VGDLSPSRSYPQRIAASVGDPAAVGRQTDAGDEPLHIIIGEKGDRRRDVDNAAAPAMQHLSAQVFAQEERTQQIDVHHTRPPGGCRVLRRRDQTDSGVVYKDIKAAVVPMDLFSQLLHKGF